TKETLLLLVMTALLLCVVISIGIQFAFVPPNLNPKLFSFLIWVVFLFSSTVSIGRSFEYELKNCALDGLLLTGVAPSIIYFSKFITTSSACVVSHLVATLALSTLLNVTLSDAVGGFLLVSLLIILGYNSLATLLSAITVRSRLRGLLLPLILIPLLFPLLFSAIELSNQAIVGGALDFSSVWFSLLLGFDVIYFALALNLFGFTVRD
ncbi:MAG: heme exporter protein CcmB, partial [Bdellovibrionales bacterium]|nr:heme exporter protein CcmB [Bdellovibrionales bacterium]